MEPPIHTEYFLSGGATTLIFIVDGARAVSSFVILSAMPGYMVVPPDMTMLAYKSLLISMSHFMMVWKVQSWMPDASLPMREGWKSTSGHLNLSFPMTITFPSVMQ